MISESCCDCVFYDDAQFCEYCNLNNYGPLQFYCDKKTEKE